MGVAVGGAGGGGDLVGQVTIQPNPAAVVVGQRGAGSPAAPQQGYHQQQQQQQPQQPTPGQPQVSVVRS